MISVDEAQDQVLREVSVLGTEGVPLADAAGRVLRADVGAPRDVPALDNSAMDGYAVRAADTPGSLRVTGEIPAGSLAARPLDGGTAMRIMTGAPIPPGADAVAPVEITDGGAERVEVKRAVPPGANIRRAGEDMRAGSVVLRCGTLIGAGEVGVLATVQQLEVTVARRPRVAILSTGDELVDLEADVAPGKTVNSNAYALAALVRGSGGEPAIRGIVRDDREATVGAIESALDCDFIVSSGGVSVGAYDFVKEALDALGAATKFWRVAMKPGKPIVFARVRERLYFGLPGNPASSFVSFALFVAPAIRKALGRDQLFEPTVMLRTVGDLKGAGERRAYLRVRVSVRDGELVAEPMQGQGSGLTTSMVQANGLAIVEAGVARVEAGRRVPVVLLSLS